MAIGTSWRGRILATGAVLMSAVAIAVPVVTGGGPAPSGTANLWIDTSGGSCSPNHAPQTPQPYNDATACGSMQAAVAASLPGETIRMVAGNYGSQSVTSSKTSPGVTVIGETDSSDNRLVNLAGLNTLANWLEFRDFNVAGGWSASNQTTGFPHDLTFRNIDWNGGGFFISACCDNISFIGGAVHGVEDGGADKTCPCAPGTIMVQGNAASTPISDITFDGMEFYDNDCSSNSVPTNHYEVFRINAWASNIVVRNSYFHDNRVNSSQIFTSTNTVGHTPGPIIVEGNYFASTQAPSGCNRAAAFRHVDGNMETGTAPDILVRNNTAQAQAVSDVTGYNAGSALTNIKLIGNISPKTSPGNCSGATYSHNVWISGSSVGCGTGDITVASAAAAGLIGDGFHLDPSSIAINAGDPASCPATDRDGDARPLGGSVCDAGADEVN